MYGNENECRINESEIIVLALDESGSMSGNRWTNAVAGAKQLIDHIRNNSLNQHNIHIVIIFFDDTARLKHESCISDPIPEDIWAPNYGGTSYGPVFELAIFKISNYI